MMICAVHIRPEQQGELPDVDNSLDLHQAVVGAIDKDCQPNDDFELNEDL